MTAAERVRARLVAASAESTDDVEQNSLRADLTELLDEYSRAVKLLSVFVHAAAEEKKWQ